MLSEFFLRIGAGLGILRTFGRTDGTYHPGICQDRHLCRLVAHCRRGANHQKRFAVHITQEANCLKRGQGRNSKARAFCKTGVIRRRDCLRLGHHDHRGGSAMRALPLIVPDRDSLADTVDKRFVTCRLLSV